MSAEEQIEEEPDIDFNEVVRLRDRLMPYQRPIMIVLFIIMIMLVVFLGFAYGSARVCNEAGGFLDDKFECHLDCSPEYKPTEYSGVKLNLNFSGDSDGEL